MLSRRQLLATGLGAAAVGWPARTARADGVHWTLKDIVLGGDTRVGTRFTMLVPKTDEKVPLLVALHGLGETHDQKLGAYAWIDRYGLGSCYDRLCAPPVERESKKARYWDDDRLAEVNRWLKTRPMRGIAVCCPYTPNVYKSPLGRDGVLDAYADWIAGEVLPRARQEANVYTDAEHTFLDGCSLGGYVGIEVFLRKPERFGAWGSVQGALGAHRVPGYAKRLAEVIATHGKRPIHIETSSGDAFREVNESLSSHLNKLGVDHVLRMPPGPHNQPFLRDSGTLEMLLWYDRLPR